MTTFILTLSEADNSSSLDSLVYKSALLYGRGISVPVLSPARRSLHAISPVPGPATH